MSARDKAWVSILKDCLDVIEMLIEKPVAEANRQKARDLLRRLRLKLRRYEEPA